MLKETDLEVEESHGDVLDELVRDVFRVELGPELELQRRLLLHVLAQHLLVQLEPRLVALGVGVLETKEPDLAKTNGFHHLQKKEKNWKKRIK